MAPRPLTVLLVHGAWHGAWCWAPLQAELDARGVPSFAVDLPGHGASSTPYTDLHGDAAHVADVIAALDRPVVLTGHSYGGAVVTQAGADAKPGSVAHVVYLAAFALDVGESVLGYVGSVPAGPVALGAAMQFGDDGLIRLDAEVAAPALYGQCPPSAIDAALPRLDRQPVATFNQEVSGAAWRTLPSTYVVCARDEAVHPTHQRSMAQRCGTTHTLDADHSPFVSAVAATADILEGIARG